MDECQMEHGVLWEDLRAPWFHTQGQHQTYGHESAQSFLGKTQSSAFRCWTLWLVHVQMGSRSFPELWVWCQRTDRRPHYLTVSHTSGTPRNVWSDGLGWRDQMLAELSRRQHLTQAVWQPWVVKGSSLVPWSVGLFWKRSSSTRRRRRNLRWVCILH